MFFTLTKYEPLIYIIVCLNSDINDSNTCPRSMIKFGKYSLDKHFNCVPNMQPVEPVCYHGKISKVCHPSFYEMKHLYIFSLHLFLLSVTPDLAEIKKF